MEFDTEQPKDREIEEEKPREILSKKSNISLRIALMAIMTALVMIVTFYFTIPITPTAGYFNIGESIIYITAILFGPYIGAFAGGVGASLADVLIAPEYAPITLVVKALEGFVVGYAFRYLRKLDSTSNKFRSKTFAILLGIPFMILGYLISQYFILGYGPAAYIEILWNLIQCGGGLIIALPLITALEQIAFLKDQDIFS